MLPVRPRTCTVSPDRDNMPLGHFGIGCVGAVALRQGSMLKQLLNAQGAGFTVVKGGEGGGWGGSHQWPCTCRPCRQTSRRAPSARSCRPAAAGPALATPRRWGTPAQWSHELRLDAPHGEVLRVELPCRLFSACHHMRACRRLYSRSCNPASVERSALRPGCGSEVACLLATSLQ